MPQNGRRYPVLLVATAAALCCSLAVATPYSEAGSPHGPSAGQVAAARGAVAHRQHEVAAEQAALAGAQAGLRRLNVLAAAAIQRYDNAMSRLAAAEATERAAMRALAAATARLRRAHRQMDSFGVAAYMSGGPVADLTSVIGAEGPSQFLSQQTQLQAISHRVQQAIDAFVAARAYRQRVEAKAALAVRHRQAAAATAAQAKVAALSQVNRQLALVAQMRAAQARLNALLYSAESRARQLAAQRAAYLAAVAAARREAPKVSAARTAQAGAAANPPPVGTAYQSIARYLAAPYGWSSGAEWAALNNIVMAESGWNPLITNPSSGAFGIAQALGHGTATSTAQNVTHEYPGGGSYVGSENNYPSEQANAGDATAQIAWMLYYIKASYGDPINGWAYHVAHGTY